MLAIVLAMSAYFLTDTHKLVKTNESEINELSTDISLANKEIERQAEEIKELRSNLRDSEKKLSNLQNDASILPYKYGLKEVK